MAAGNPGDFQPPQQKPQPRDGHRSKPPHRTDRFNFPSLHDWFAGEALRALVTIDFIDGENETQSEVWTAEKAYAYADAMMAERRKRQEARRHNKVGEIRVGNS
jgi:hypothetical protein